MAEHPLKPILDKLDRADEHLDTLQSDFEAFSSANPLRVNFKVNFKTEWHTAYIESGEPVPPTLSIPAGESLYHARSALEHLIWALVKANKKKPGKDHTFPIFEKPVGTKGMTHKQAFIAKARRKELAGVPMAAIALIEELQPYNTANPPYYVLAVLNRLARDDRHHALPGMFVGGADPSELQSVFVPRGRAQIVRYKTLLRKNQRLVIGKTHIARLKIKPLSRNAQVNVKGSIPMLIAFGSGRDYFPLPAFRSLNTDVRNMTRLFEKFF